MSVWGGGGFCHRNFEVSSPWGSEKRGRKPERDPLIHFYKLSSSPRFSSSSLCNRYEGIAYIPLKNYITNYFHLPIDHDFC